MATHSSILAWSIPWTEDPCGLQSTVLQSLTRLWGTWPEGRRAEKVEDQVKVDIMWWFLLSPALFSTWFPECWRANSYRHNSRISIPEKSYCCLVAKSCRILCNLMDRSLPGPSVHGILQARILEWVVMSPPGDLLHPEMEPRTPKCPSWQEDSLLLSH